MTSSSFLGEGKKFERLTLLMVLKSIILKEPAASASQLQGYCVILTPTVKVFFPRGLRSSFLVRGRL